MEEKDMFRKRRNEGFLIFVLILIVSNVALAQSGQSPFEGIWKKDNDNIYTFTGNSVLFDTIFAPGAPKTIFKGTFSYDNSKIIIRYTQMSMDRGNSWMGVAENNAWNTNESYRMNGSELIIGSNRFIRQSSSSTSQNSTEGNWKTQDQFIYDGESYRGLTIAGYNGVPSKNLIIPSEINGRRVIAIAERAFQNIQLDSLEISEGITFIGEYSFWSTGIQRLTIPETVEVIDGAAFGRNKLTNINIPENVEYIGAYAFQFNQISTLIMRCQADVDLYAFGSNPLSDVTIVSNVYTNPIMVGTSFPNGFEQYYINNGKRGGRYIFRNNNWQYSN